MRVIKYNSVKKYIGVAPAKKSVPVETIKSYFVNDHVSEELMFEKVCDKNEVSYKCTKCSCISRRRFNVVRHYKRFHFLTKERKCCGKIFYTKAEYYKHSLDIHHNTRCYSIMFANNYRMDTRTRSMSKQKKRLRSLRRKTDLHGSCNTDQEDTGEKFVDSSEDHKSFTFKIEAPKFEDIPLINFLQNPSMMRGVLDGDKLTERANSDAITNMQIETSKSAAVQNGDLAVKTEKNGADAVTFRAKSPVLLHELPLKKRILQKTLISSGIASKTHAENTCMNECHANKRPLMEVNNTSNTARNSKTNFIMTNTDKENNSKFRRAEYDINIIIDTRISPKLLTQQQRIFLSPVDFNRI